LRGSSSKQNAIADTCFLCCFLVRKLNVVTCGIVSYGFVAEVMGPSYVDLQVRTYYVSFPPEFLRLEFLSPEFRTKFILPENDPRNSADSEK